MANAAGAASRQFLSRCVFPAMRSAYSRLRERGLTTSLDFNANSRTGDDRCLLTVSHAAGVATLEFAVLALDGSLVTRQSAPSAAPSELTRLAPDEAAVAGIIDGFVEGLLQSRETDA